MAKSIPPYELICQSIDLLDKHSNLHLPNDYFCHVQINDINKKLDSFLSSFKCIYTFD